mgnify:FL=1
MCIRDSNDKALADLVNFINERWKGQYPVAWGDTVSEIQFTTWLYGGVAGLDRWAESHDIAELLH